MVTGSPVVSVNIPRWNASLSKFVPSWLTKAVACVEHERYRRAAYEAGKLISEFDRKSVQTSGSFYGDGPWGNVIAANKAAVSLLGLTGEVPIVAGAIEPAERWMPNISGLPDVLRWAKDRAQGTAQWSGYEYLPVSPGEEATALTMRSVLDSNHVVGMLCVFGVQKGESYESDAEADVGPLPVTSSACAMTGWSCSLRRRSAMPRPTGTPSGWPRSGAGSKPRPATWKTSSGRCGPTGSAECIGVSMNLFRFRDAMPRSSDECSACRVFGSVEFHRCK